MKGLIAVLFEALMDRHGRPAAAAAAIRTRGLHHALAPAPLLVWAAVNVPEEEIFLLEEDLLVELSTPGEDFFPLPEPQVLLPGPDSESPSPALLPVHP